MATRDGRYALITEYPRTRRLSPMTDTSDNGAPDRLNNLVTTTATRLLGSRRPLLLQSARKSWPTWWPSSVAESGS